MKKVFVAGHRGMVGSAILRKLRNSGGYTYCTASKAELDLTNQSAVRDFFEANRPDIVILAAAKVGGILANNNSPAGFIYENLMIQSNVIHEAYTSGVKKLLFLGSSCIYPKNTPQPILESALLTGALEPTNEPYAIAKIAGIKLCESYNRQFGVDFRSIMPTNLYGPGDNFDLQSSHVLPALIRKIHSAKSNGEQSVSVWGSGTPRREFLHVDDLADAALFTLTIPRDQISSITEPMQSHLNVGFGSDISILEVAKLIAGIIGYKGQVKTDPSKPDGTPRKLMDSSKINQLGWKPKIPLKEGIEATYRWYQEYSE